jgi:hypothetical protein
LYGFPGASTKIFNDAIIGAPEKIGEITRP